MGKNPEKIGLKSKTPKRGYITDVKTPFNLTASALALKIKFNSGYWVMQLTGHAGTQLPHSMQPSALMMALPPSITMTSVGQVPMHASQPTQPSAFTTAFAIKIPSHLSCTIEVSLYHERK